MSTVRSAKGELVDFDLLRIKQQIANTPQTATVAARQTFIDNKLKRRIKKQAQEVVKAQTDESPVLPDIMPEGAISAADEVTSTVVESKPVIKKEKK